MPDMYEGSRHASILCSWQGRSGNRENDVVAIGVPAGELGVTPYRLVANELPQPEAALPHLSRVEAGLNCASQVPRWGVPVVTTWCTLVSSPVRRSHASAASPPMLWHTSTRARPVAAVTRSTAASMRGAYSSIEASTGSGSPPQTCAPERAGFQAKASISHGCTRNHE